MKRDRLPILALLVAGALVATGCVTDKKMRAHVGQEVGAVNNRVNTVEGQVEAAQTRLDEHGRRIDEQGRLIEGTSKTANEALQRALEAGKLAEGRLLSETVLSDDKVRFGFDKSELGDEAKAALDTFAEGLKSENKGVYIEIQGHTDSIGSEPYNEELGLERAEAVRRYLNMTHGFPLHRMNVISYGESSPVTDNNSRDSRAKNRRVVLVVLK